MSTLMRVFILGHLEGASDNRTDLELKGLVSCGIDCYKLNLLPYTKSRYLYPFRFLKSFNLLFKIKKNDVVIIYGESTFFVVDTFFLRIIGCKIIFERTEYSNEVLYEDSSSKTKNTRFNFLRNLKNASGFITCSDFLSDYYKAYLPFNTKILKLSSLVDSGKFFYKGGRKYDFEYIAYCGYMGNNKDGVPILVDAFKKISPKYPKLKLLLIGTATESELITLKEQIDGFEEQIILTGSVSHETMPQLLSGAKILALARPDNKQAEGGFPSKLGEYLSTGKPVVVTKVGEIPLYIENRQNGYLADPDSVDSFAYTMEYVLDHYDDALVVGEKGLELARFFDYTNQGLVLKDYLMKL